MVKISHPDYIKCSFALRDQANPVLYNGILDIFYAETNDLTSMYPDLRNYISYEEQLRADKFHFERDRETYILCHALLRLVLADRLNVKPLEIIYEMGLNNKPGINDEPVFFNITHTKEAFAFAVSNDFYVGIDLEDINQRGEIGSIAKSFFDRSEREYIFKSITDERKRFFLLWTRKEALLKALGTGIINNLSKVEVSEKENFIDKKLFENLISDSASDEHFLYSMNFGNYYLSIAIPHKAAINLHNFNNESIVSYLD